MSRSLRPSLASRRRLSMEQGNLFSAMLQFRMRFGLVLLLLAPSSWSLAEKPTNAASTAKATNSTNAAVQKELAEIKELKKEVEELKQEEAGTVKQGVAPRIQQQGTGQNIGGTTEKVDLLDKTNSK